MPFLTKRDLKGLPPFTASRIQTEVNKLIAALTNTSNTTINKIRLIIANSIGAKIETQDPAGPDLGGRRLRLLASAFDGRDSAGMVGVIIGVDSDALGPPNPGPVKFTSGDHNYDDDGYDVGATYARYIPIVHEVGSAQMFSGPPTSRLIGIVSPHWNVFAEAGAGIVISGDNIGHFDEGAPDLQGDITVQGRHLGRYILDGLAVGESIWFGDGPGTGSFIAQPIGESHGSSNMPSKAGEVRRGFDEREGFRYENININGSQNQPQHCAMSCFMNFDPPSQVYPPGVTVVKVYKPNDFGAEGFSSFLLHNFNLPPALVNGDGQLNPGFQLFFSSGSYELPRYNTDTGPRPPLIDRNSFATNSTGSRLVEIHMIVNNTGDEVTADMDYFQIDGVVI